MITRVVVHGYRVIRSIDFTPRPGTNILVGDNDSGKSTLLELITLALTGRVNGRWAQDVLDPYWFNAKHVADFFASIGGSSPLSPPEILIEVYLASDSPDIQILRGVYNSRHEDSPGVKIHIAPSPDYKKELADYFNDAGRPPIIPTEWYEVDWRDFRDEQLVRRPKGLGVAHIDSRTIRSSTGVDYHTREILGEFISPSERASVAIAHRRARHEITNRSLDSANRRIADQGRALHDRPIGLQMDQSSSASWENTIVPTVSDIPFAMAGHGQQATIKLLLAMARSPESTAFAMIEEPENHLSHTSLTKLVARIEELAGARQVFVTTHSSFVLNRLGLDKLVLLAGGHHARFDDLPAGTVAYFKRLSGYDTLRLVLAERVVLVEGPSDEMVFECAFRRRNDGKLPMELGVDVISMAGVSLRRGLQLCAALERQAAAIRDNDGKKPDHWKEPLAALLSDGQRDVFIGNPDNGPTLEPQFLAFNDEAGLREFFGIPETKATLEWLKAHKTEWTLKLALSDFKPVYPDYIVDAVEFVS